MSDNLSSACIQDLLFTVQDEQWSELQPLTTLCVVVQASYILVKGGSLQIGREDAPFPGAAKITLYGPPDSRELPLYGAKVCACPFCLVSTIFQSISDKLVLCNGKGSRVNHNMPALNIDRICASCHHTQTRSSCPGVACVLHAVWHDVMTARWATFLCRSVGVFLLALFTGPGCQGGPSPPSRPAQASNMDPAQRNG
jgi:hypothetical protein